MIDTHDFSCNKTAIILNYRERLLMPRTQRLKINDETTVYHVMSRTALDGFPIGDVEKDFMLDLIRRYAVLYLVEILRLCFTQLNSLKKNVLHLCPAE